MAKAKKLPSGAWRVQAYAGKEDGKNKYISFTAPSKEEAEFLAAQYKLTKDKKDTSNLTLGEAMDRYIESKSNVLSPSTVRQYKVQRRTMLTDIMDIKLSKLTQEDVQISINKLAKKLSVKSVSNAHGLLTATLKEYAPHMTLNTKLPQKRKQSIVIPTAEDISRLLEHTQGTDLETAIMLAAFAGLRRGEVAALTYSDFKDGKVKVRRAIVLNENNEWVKKPPKTFTSNRVIDIPDFVITHIEDKQKAGKPFMSMNPAMISNQFKRIVALLGLPSFSFHDLRHYYASVMLMLNIPDKYAMERMGHSTNTMLKNVYQHLMEGKKTEVGNTINTYFSTTISHEISHEKQKI